jgi:hypothetical protein
LTEQVEGQRDAITGMDVRPGEIQTKQYDEILERIKTTVE